jgi:hypothetical protein
MFEQAFQPVEHQTCSRTQLVLEQAEQRILLFLMGSCSET